MKKKNKYNWLYYFYILQFIHEPLSSIVNFDRGGRLILTINIIVFVILFFNDKRSSFLLKTTPVSVFFILILYHFINAYFQEVPRDYDWYAFYGVLFIPFSILFYSVFLFHVDEKKFVRTGIISYILYWLLAYQTVNINTSTMRLEGSIHPNQFAQCIGFGLLFLTYIKVRYDLSAKIILFVSIPALYLIIQCGSRNGLVLFAFYLCALIGSVILKKGRISFRTFVSGMVLVIISFFIIKNVIETTSLGERILSVNESFEESNNEYLTGTVFDSILGERVIYYVLGFENFIDNPIFGIGVWNFSNYNDFPFPLHSEYMIHLAEGGIIGFILYVFFIYSLGAKIFIRFFEKKNALYFTLTMSFIVYLLIGLTARELFYVQFYPVLGLCCSQLNFSKYKNYEENFVC